METQKTIHRHKFEYWNKNVFKTFNFHFSAMTVSEARK